MDKYQQFEIKSSDNDAVEFYHENPVAFYNEDDLLKDISITDFLGNEDNSLTMEHYNAFNIIGEYLLGYCYNSLPPFARKEKYEEGCDNFLNNLHEDLSILQKDNNGVRPFEIECPKIAWGFTAFLITHSIIDTKGRLRVKIGGQEKTLIFLEERYLKSQKENYDKLKEDDYEYYSANSCNDEIRELDTLFIKQHIEQERNLLERTKKGNNSDIIGAYLNYSEKYIEFLENKYIEVNREQEVLSDSINNENDSTIKKYPEKLLELFRGKDYLIDSLNGLSDKQIAYCIKKWAKEKDKSGKPLIENPDNALKSSFAEELKNAGIITQSKRTFRDRL